MLLLRIGESLKVMQGTMYNSNRRREQAHPYPIGQCGLMSVLRSPRAVWVCLPEWEGFG